MRMGQTCRLLNPLTPEYRKLDTVHHVGGIAIVGLRWGPGWNLLVQVSLS